MCRVLDDMRRSCLLLFLVLLATGLIWAQGTISVDAVSAMRVCSDKDSASGLPCATAPRPLSKVNPVYPEKARQQRKEGTVTLGLTVNKDGSVSGVHVVNGVDKDIDRAAIEAVNQWKFDPGTYQGNPVDVELAVTVNFRLSTSPQRTSPVGNLQGQKEAVDDSRNLYSDALEAYNRGDYATAANLLRKVTSLTPQNSSAWNDLGRALMAMTELDTAVQAFQASIKNDPTSRNAYNNLGLVYWRQRKYEDAAAQFRRQIVVNPDDHYAHRNLGMMMRDQKRCSEAMAEIQKALALTPNHVETLLAEGECDLDLGNQAKGISELQQAISVSSAPNVFNSAAYVLAKRNIEISMAEKWSDTCLTIETTRLKNVSDIPLDHLTPEQLNYVFWMSAYWDTRGWIYFLRGDNSAARSFVEAAWSLRTDPSVGDHLGRIYEKLGRSEDAAKVYAMAIASADQPKRTRVDLDDLADAKKQLAKLAAGNTDNRIKQGDADLSKKSVVLLANEGAVSASAEFGVRVAAPGKPSKFQQLNGDKTLEKVTESLQASKLPVFVPESSGVEVPLRGTLTCHSEEAQCRFAFLSPEEAVNMARNEMALASTTSAANATHDPHVYDDTAMGMRIFLPDEWKLVRVEPGSFSQPRNAMFGKSGSLAMFMLTRERFEGSLELYQKMLDRFFASRTDFKRAGEQTVKRDGLTGTRWNVSWNERGIDYSAVIEMFGEGDDYYRVTTLAPKDVYDRYAETFESVLRSVQFPMLRLNPHNLDPEK
jgi:TonB family protein